MILPRPVRQAVGQDAADRDAVEVAARAIEARIRLDARTIREKYVEPPHTTDFAILFLPTEGLFAEVLRRIGAGHALLRAESPRLTQAETGRRIAEAEAELARAAARLPRLAPAQRGARPALR
jgi:hypothetical protein